MKKIAILGTGMVGTTIGKKLIELGYEVKMGSRTADNAKAAAWVNENGSRASQGTFSDAAKFGDIVFLCTKGEHTIDALKMATVENFSGKTVIDISNPLDFSRGMPPTLIPTLCNTYSLGEEVQKLLTDARVVKTLNIVNCEIMVDATRNGAEATMFVAGNDVDAKKEVSELLNKFGWRDIIDLGDITHARSTEMMLPIWLSTFMATQNPYIAFKIVR